MAWHLIFNIKKISELALVLGAALLIMFLNSCKDSLGYDPNVEIQEIIKDTIDIPPDDSNTGNTIKVDSIKFTFREIVKINNFITDFSWDGLAIKKEFKIDTANNQTSIWIDWEMESKARDTDYINTRRLDRITSFELNFAASLNSREYLLQKSRESRRWFAINIKKIRDDNIYNYHSNMMRSHLQILELDRRRGIIKMFIVSELPPQSPLQIRRFEILLEVFYKTK